MQSGGSRPAGGGTEKGRIAAFMSDRQNIISGSFTRNVRANAGPAQEH
jgi:hypothetical protein